jgi:hypothetical protein
MTFIQKRCPKCHGNIILDTDYYGRYKECFQCGHITEIERIKGGQIMVWVKIEGTDGRLRRAIKDTKDRAHIQVRDTNKQFYIEIPEQELGWLDKIKTDLNLTTQIIGGEGPTYQKTPCGVNSVNPKWHILACNACKALRGPPKVKKPHDGVSKTIFTLPGLPDFSLNGLVSYLKDKRDEAMAMATELDSAIIAVEKLEGLETQLKSLQAEKIEQVKALDFFLGKG